jgi:5-dehydro-4-deoxyglucarate dehydratase
MTDPQELRSKLQGVVSFPVTPFKKDLSLDLDGLRANVRRLLDHPICAIVPAAGTGELFALSPQEQLAALKATLEEVDGKIPVLAATGFNPPLAVEIAKQSADAGADGILAFPPYYPNADRAGMADYYRLIADATPLGMIVYTRDWASFTPDQAERLADIDKLVAWKDGQGDIREFQMIISRLGDRFRWIGGAGDDLVPGYYSLGVRTYTSSIANVAPKLSLKLHDLASAGRSAELDELMLRHVVPLYELRARRRGYEVSAMKTMMDMQGQVGGPVRPPLVEVTDSERKELRAMLDGWKPFL